MYQEYNNILTIFYRGLTIPEKSFLILLSKYPKSGMIAEDVFCYPYAFGFNVLAQHLQLKGLATETKDGKRQYELRITELGKLIVDNYLYSDPLMRARKTTLVSMVKGEALSLSKKYPR